MKFEYVNVSFITPLDKFFRSYAIENMSCCVLVFTYKSLQNRTMRKTLNCMYKTPNAKKCYELKSIARHTIDNFFIWNSNLNSPFFIDLFQKNKK